MSTVFALQKTAVRRAFATACGSYDAVAAMQRASGRELLAQYVAGELHGDVLDAGCGTGFLTGLLAGYGGYRQLLAVDFALPMLEAARAKLAASNRVCYLGADVEHLPLADNSIDWLFSNLALQWCRDLDVVYNELRRVLKPQRRLLFSTFGPQTLRELKAAWAQVDSYPHVHEFYSAAEIHEALVRAGFEQVRIAARCHTNSYATPLTLMRELKNMGAHNAAVGRKRTVTTRAQVRRMTNAYEQWRKKETLPATFEILLVAAVKA